MSQHLKPSQRIDIRKVSLFAITVNTLELFVLTGVVVYMIFMDGDFASSNTARALIIVSALMAAWGAVLDMRQALTARRRVRAIAGLESTNQMMDALNHRLRAQRHDFLNHLQVVYSLMEMQEYRDAMDYLEKVYGETRAVSGVLRTQSTAVNALLQVKTAAFKEANIPFSVNITSALEAVPIPAWELCCVLGNLLDNALDASRESNAPVTLEISENLKEFIWVVRNPGIAIPKDLQERIFEAGVTTKGEGRGMGLKIVRQTLEQYSGKISVQSSIQETAFTVRIPKHVTEPEPA